MGLPNLNDLSILHFKPNNFVKDTQVTALRNILTCFILFVASCAGGDQVIASIVPVNALVENDQLVARSGTTHFDCAIGKWLGRSDSKIVPNSTSAVPPMNGKSEIGQRIPSDAGNGLASPATMTWTGNGQIAEIANSFGLPFSKDDPTGKIYINESLHFPVPPVFGLLKIPIGLPVKVVL